MLARMHRPSRIERVVPGPGQESVWDYPRPPKVDPTERHVVVRFGGVVVADTRRAVRVLETSQAPAFYLPPDDVDLTRLRAASGSSWCEWKGEADYVDVVVGDLVAERAGWRYQHPVERFATITGCFSFYPHLLECTVDGVRAEPMPGAFYGGWVTPDVVGPFKGAPGTLHW